MSKYTAEFQSINSIDYKIEITTSSGSTNKTMLLGETPFVVTASDNDSIYEPVKTTGATISLLTSSFMPELYSGTSLGTSVKVTSGTKVIWTGYLTPCVYSQNYDKPLEELQLECVDGLAVLQDIPYSSAVKEIKSFINIIFNCLKKTNCFKTLFVSNSLQFNDIDNISVFEKIRVSEANFFESKDYEAQPDNDVAMSCFDVLTEICKYLCCTILSHGEDVYILDYDAIINNKNSYWRYDISGNSISTPVQVNLSHTYNIKDGSYAETGTAIEMTSVFNKLRVKDDFYIIDSVVDGLNNSKNWINITAPNDEKLLSWVRSGRYKESMVFTMKNKNGEDESFFVVLATNWAGRLYFVLGKFYKNPFITTYHYSDANNSVLPESKFDNNMQYSKLWDGKGAVCVGLYTQDIDMNIYNEWQRRFWTNNRPPQYTFTGENKPGMLKSYGELCGLANIENKKLTNYILCLNYDKSHIDHSQVTKYPYFTIKKEVPSTFGGKNAYIIIQGNLIRHDEYETPFPMGAKDELREKNTSIYKNESYFWASLKWGAKYWEPISNFGTLGGKWVDTLQYFPIPYGNNDAEQKSAEFFDKNLPFYNTAAKIWGLNDENGYYVPAPTDENLVGNIELTVYANNDTKGKWGRVGKKDKKNSYSTYPPKVVLFKELDIKLCFADDAMNEDAAKADTYYTNEPDYQNVTEGDEISCKICTFDNKNPSYSTTDYVDESGASQYIDKLYHAATQISLRPEEHIVYKQVNQYEEPKLKLNANLKADIDIMPYSVLTANTLSGKKFIVDGINVDYRFNKAECHLVEKNKTYK